MKLILTAEVDHLGTAGDTVEVKDGYGRNFLLPRGLAILASRGAERQAAEIRRAPRCLLTEVRKRLLMDGESRPEFGVVSLTPHDRSPQNEARSLHASVGRPGSTEVDSAQCICAERRPRRAAIVTRSASESAFILRMT